MRTVPGVSLVIMVLAACVPDRRHDAQDEVSQAGTVLQDSDPSASYRLRMTYDGPPVIASSSRITFHVSRQASTSQATARLDIDLVRGTDLLTGENGDLAPAAGTEQNLVDLGWVDWCVQPPCDASADLTIDLLPATGAANPPVDVSTIAVTSTVTYETEDSSQTGTVEVTLTPF
jgi:hypothetical protein